MIKCHELYLFFCSNDLAFYSPFNSFCSNDLAFYSPSNSIYVRFCLFDLGLTSLSTIFQSYRDGVWM